MTATQSIKLGAGSTSTDGGGESWINSNNALDCDGIYATVILSPATSSKGLNLLDYPLSAIPHTAKLLGIKATVEWFDDGSSACNSFVLTQDGTPVAGSDNKADPIVNLPTGVETRRDFGDSTDLWNTGFVNGKDLAGLGVRMIFTHRSGGNVIVSIDCVTLEIFFEDAGGGGYFAMSEAGLVCPPLLGDCPG
jgi:hypothetical protein